MDQTLLEELIIKADGAALKNYLSTNALAVKEPTSLGVSPLMLSCYYKKPEITDIFIFHLEEINLFEASAAGKFDVVAHQIFKNPTNIPQSYRS